MTDYSNLAAYVRKERDARKDLDLVLEAIEAVPAAQNTLAALQAEIETARSLRKTEHADFEEWRRVQQVERDALDRVAEEQKAERLRNIDRAASEREIEYREKYEQLIRETREAAVALEDVQLRISAATQLLESLDAKRLELLQTIEKLTAAHALIA